ncbi:MAG: PadR family transcriptional regulator [Desulfomonile tiedjei]|uniref:PadR family transcriptional regulator n=1 Tax=Desulfomonile tiedjei TaxID=2358 RepID=A0A9D6YZI0_9BACT|nr:PadR family transcriptional regulator [Desulfomonile tiedjei]
MDVQSVLLGFLMRNSMTGYDLKKSFSISFSFFSGLSYGSIYPALKKMERQGLISMRLEIQDGAPNRKVYTITETGRTCFLESLSAPFSPEQPKNSFLMRLFFFAHLSTEQRKVTSLKHLDSIEQIKAQLEAARPEIEARADRFQYLCFEFGVRCYNDMARNLSHIINELEEDREEAEK